MDLTKTLYKNWTIVKAGNWGNLPSHFKKGDDINPENDWWKSYNNNSNFHKLALKSEVKYNQSGCLVDWLP